MKLQPVTLYKGTNVGRFEMGVAVLEEQQVFGPQGSTGCWTVETLASAMQLGERGLTEEQLITAKGMLSNNLSVFSTGDTDLGRTRVAYHQIETGQNRAVKMNPRKIPVHFEKEVEAQLEQMQSQGVIRPSHSPWAAPVVIVRKKDGGLRFCVDYRRLNELTIKDAYPLPRIDDTLDALGASKWFSTLDLASGYWQVELDPRHREKTAFVTKHGFYEFNVLPYGLCNAPSTFQRLMELVLADLQWMTCLVYLDDIIVFGRTFEEHISRLGEVLGRLKSAELKVKPAKCTLFSKRVNYLGHVISAEGVGTDPAKAETVRSWPTPTTVGELRSFLGLASYYRRFIAGFGSIAQPLHRLTEKKTQFQWSNACQEAFDILKQRLITAPILAYPDPTKKFILDTDASDQGIGSVLSQMHGDQERVVAYASRSLSRAERNYATTRKELLAVVAFTRYFRHYLLGREFLLRTDHNSLRWLHNFKEPEGQVARWLEQLSSFQYCIRHRPGKQHTNADALSRRAADCQVATVVSMSGNDDGSLYSRQRNDPVLRQLISLKLQGCSRDAAELQSSSELKPYCAVWDMLYLDRDVLSYKDSRVDKGGQGVLPRSMVPSTLHSLHNCRTGGHLGVEKLLDRVRSRFYWPGWTQDVKEWCKSCHDCAANKITGPAPRAPLQTTVTSRPFERIALDILGPLPFSEKGNRYILVLADYFTKWAEAFPLVNQEAKTVAGVFVNEFILRFGAPRTVHTDQGRNFESHLFQEICELLEMHKTRTTPYHPQSDGLVERLNKTLTTMLSNFVNANQSDWDALLPYVMMAYRSSMQSSTKHTPYEALLGRQIVLPVDVLMDQCEEGYSNVHEYVQTVRQRLRTVAGAIQRHQQAASQSQKEFYDLKISHQYYEPGERVWVRDKRRRRGQCPKLKKRFAGPYLVLERLSDVLYRLKGDNGDTVVHFNRLKPCYDSDSRLAHLNPNDVGDRGSWTVGAPSAPVRRPQEQRQRAWFPSKTESQRRTEQRYGAGPLPAPPGDPGPDVEDHPHPAPPADSGPDVEDHPHPAPPADSGPDVEDHPHPAPPADSGPDVGHQPCPTQPAGLEAANGPQLGGARRPQRERRPPLWLAEFDVNVNTVGCVDVILFKGGGSVMNGIYHPCPHAHMSRWNAPAPGWNNCAW